MTPLLYAFPGFESIGAELARALDAELGTPEVRRFPDGEDYVRLVNDPADRSVVLVCGLDRPDEKILPVYFAACTARELGATRVGLVAPYLGYMRQDARFGPGEAISSRYFARWLSGFVDWMATVDPHLHRYASLDAIYSIPTTAVSAAPAIARWLRAHVRDALVIGPDAESAQWAGQIAAGADCPFAVCTKQRRGDREVSVSLPNLGAWRDRTPVLVDDIISTGRTMSAAVAQLRSAGMGKPPICIGVHALFADDAYAALTAAGAATIVTCNTVAHTSNAIDVTPEIVAAITWRMNQALR
jgi:ribose-phosphate pyrophosphokinase